MNIDLEIADGVPVNVEYDYTPGYPATLYPVDRAEPGSGPEIEIHSVEVCGGDLYMALTEETIERIIDQIAEYHES